MALASCGPLSRRRCSWARRAARTDRGASWNRTDGQPPDLIQLSRSVIMFDAMRRSLLLLLSFPALAADPLVPRESFAKAHVSLMARSQSGDRDARLAEIDLW